MWHKVFDGGRTNVLNNEPLGRPSVVFSIEGLNQNFKKIGILLIDP